jgi:hypothetical protein
MLWSLRSPTDASDRKVVRTTISMVAESGADGSQGNDSQTVVSEVGGLRAGGSQATIVIGITLVLSASLVPPRPALLAGVAMALSLVLLRDTLALHRALRLALRLRWFFLSLVLLFGWLPPGTDAGWNWMPSALGLAEAGRRILALLLLVAWIAWVMQAFHRAELITGLAVWLRPLGWLGISGERFSQRLFLAIAYFEERRAQTPAPRTGDGMSSRASRWWALRERLVGQIVWALSAPPEPPESSGSAQGAPVGGAFATKGRRERVMAWVGMAILLGWGAHALGLEAALIAWFR